MSNKVLGCAVPKSIYSEFRKICIKYDITVSDVLFVFISNWLKACNDVENIDDFIKEFIEKSKIVRISERIHKWYRYNNVPLAKMKKEGVV